MLHNFGHENQQKSVTDIFFSNDARFIVDGTSQACIFAICNHIEQNTLDHAFMAHLWFFEIAWPTSRKALTFIYISYTN